MGDGVSNPVKVKGVNASQNILYIYVNNWEHLKLWIQSQLRITITVAGFSAGRDKEVLAPSPSLAGGSRWGERGEEISADTGTESSCPILDAVSLLTAFPTHTTTKQFQFKAPRQLVIKGRKKGAKPEYKITWSLTLIPSYLMELEHPWMSLALGKPLASLWWHNVRDETSIVLQTLFQSQACEWKQRAEAQHYYGISFLMITGGVLSNDRLLELQEC